MKINSPVTDYTGDDQYGGVVLEFRDGVAEVDELPAAVRQYLQGAGYGIDTNPVPPEATEAADPRDLGDGQVGTKLRDAAVEPREGDFLVPTNAGKANPHGPEVVSPELHGSEGVRPVKPGEVEGAPAQDPAETKHAAQGTFEAQPPAGNASVADWEAYALTQGRTPEELDGLSRNQIRDLFN